MDIRQDENTANVKKQKYFSFLLTVFFGCRPWYINPSKIALEIQLNDKKWDVPFEIRKLVTISGWDTIPQNYFRRTEEITKSAVFTFPLALADPVFRIEIRCVKKVAPQPILKIL